MPKGVWWIVEMAAACAFLAIPTVIFANYSEVPQIIPTHFGIRGTPNGFGDKSFLYFFVAVSAFVFGLLSATPFYPNLINNFGARTPENTQSAITLTRVVKLEVMAFFAFLSWRMVETALGHADGVTGAIPFIFVLILVATIVFGQFITSRNAN